MANPHHQAITNGRKTTDKLRQMFREVGSHEHPSGAVFAAYMQARRALRGNLDNGRVVNEVMNELKRSIRTTVTSQYNDAVSLGNEQAQGDLSAYGLRPVVATLPIVDAVQSTMLIVSQQETAIRSGMFDEGTILGDESRVGLLSPGNATRETADWLTRLTVLAWLTSVQQGAAGGEFYKQAVAALDKRTTETCLNVHGQVQPLNGLFTLTGTPRYANQLDRPPFHNFCRTVVALVEARYVSDQVTADMKRAAEVELERQQTTKEGA